MRWGSEPSRGSPPGHGSRLFSGHDPAPRAQIYYSLTQKAEKVSLKVLDYQGKAVREWPGKDGSLPAEPGLHRIGWDLVTGPEPAPERGSGGPGGGGGGGQGGRGRRG